VQVCVARSPQLIKSRGAEASPSHRRIRKWIEVCLAAHAAADLGHVRVDQVRDLRITRAIARGGGSGDREWRSGIVIEIPFEPPPPRSRRANALRHHRLAFAER